MIVALLFVVLCGLILWVMADASDNDDLYL